MARQQEAYTSDPMLPKTLVQYFDDNQVLVEDATATWYQAAASELAFTASKSWTAADPKSTMTIDAANNSFDLPAGKWVFDVHLAIDNTAAGISEIECAVTDETDGGSQTLYAQSEPTLPHEIGASTMTCVQFSLIVHLTAQTSGLQVRVANTQSGGNGTPSAVKGSYVKIQKVANKYDS